MQACLPACYACAWMGHLLYDVNGAGSERTPLHGACDAGGASGLVKPGKKAAASRQLSSRITPLEPIPASPLARDMDPSDLDGGRICNAPFYNASKVQHWPVSECGVSLEFLQRFLAQHNIPGDMSTANVVQTIIKPATRKTKCR